VKYGQQGPERGKSPPINNRIQNCPIPNGDNPYAVAPGASKKAVNALKHFLRPSVRPHHIDSKDNLLVSVHFDLKIRYSTSMT
jgi:hypothetical protein